MAWCAGFGWPIAARASSDRDFDVDVLLAPKRQPGQPILAVDCFACPREVFFGKNACCGGELRASDFAPDRAWGDPYLGIVPKPFEFARIAASHYVELAVVFAEPHGSCDRHPGFAKSGERNVFMALDFGRNRHSSIVLKAVCPDLHMAATVRSGGHAHAAHGTCGDRRIARKPIP